MSLRHLSRVCLRACQAVKEQKSKGASLKPPKITRSCSDKVGLKRVSPMVMESVKKADKKIRMTKAEKAENVMHLVCWGPN